MFKYTPINLYSLRNLQNNQIYFNSPLNFNDPFDTFQPAKLTKLSSSKLVDLYCKSNNQKFNKKHLLGILDKTIPKQEFYDFCEKHIDHFFAFDDANENKLLELPI